MSMTNEETLAIVNYFAELGMLKRLDISGMRLAGYTDPNRIAMHVARAAQIGYVLAYLEGADPEKTACIVLFHDNGEARVGDQHKVSARYFNISDAELQAVTKQVSQLPAELGEKILGYFLSFEKRDTPEAIIAKDADWLEAAITAKELMEQGASSSLQNWIDNVRAALETESAQRILAQVESMDNFTATWWKDLKKMTYTKLEKDPNGA